MAKEQKLLAVGGKSINIAKIADKTLAQFKQQLKQNSINLTDEHAAKLYAKFGGGANRN